MHALGFADTITASGKLSTQRTYQHDVCTKVDEAYTANLLRVESLTFVPGYTFFMAQGETRPFKGAYGPVDNTNSEGLRLVANQLRESTEEAERVCGSNFVMHAAFHALLQTMVIQSWTAFEVMAEKLWDDVLNAGLTSITRPSKKEARDKKIGSGSRAKIRNAYKFIFDRDNTTLMGVLTDNSIDALAVMRNVFIHSAGIIDDDFMKHSDGIPVLLPFRTLGENRSIELTGQTVRTLIDPVSQRGYGLLRELDGWIKKHP